MARSKFKSSRFFDRKPVPRRISHLPQRRPHFEALEPRILLSSDFVFGAAAAFDLTLQLDDDGSHLKLIDNNNYGEILQSQAVAEIAQVQITGTDGDDRLVVDLTSPALQTISVQFNDNSLTDNDRLEITGAAPDMSWLIDGPNAGSTSTGIEFQGIENLMGGADNEDTFVFEPGGSIIGLIEGGADGFDSLVVDGGAYSSVTFGYSGPNSGTVELDGNVIAYDGLEPVLLDTDPVPANIVFNITAGADEAVLENDPTAGSSRLRSVNGTFETTTFVNPTGTLTINLLGGGDTLTINALDATFAANVVINAGDQNDIITVNDVTGTGVFTINGNAGNDSFTVHSIGDKTVNLNGGADNDTYRFNNTGSSVGTVNITDVSGTDTVNFTNFSGNLTTLTSTGATGADGSVITYAAGTIENVVGAQNKLELTTSQINTFLNGLQSLVTWAKALNNYAELGMELPIIAGNIPVSVGEAMQIAETFDQLRLRVLNHIHSLTTVTTQDLLNALSGYAEGGIEHLDRAILGDLKDATILAGDTFGFYVNLDSTGEVALTGITGATSLGDLVLAINGAIAAQQSQLIGKVQAVVSEGRIAIQAIGNEFNSLAVRGNTLAVSKLGFKSTAQSVLDGALEGLGNLSITVEPATLAVNIVSGVPEIELHLAPSASRTTNFAVDLGADAGSNGIQFAANATLAATASFSANLDLRLVLGSTSSFLLDLNSLTADLSMNAVVNADISIGFLGAHVDGNINMTADPGLNISGSDIALSQLNTGNIAAFTTGFTTSSSLDADLNVSLSSALSGLDLSALTPKIEIDSSNLFTGNRDDVSVVFTDLVDLFKFDNISAANLAGLLGQLTTWLKSMTNSQFEDIDVPFTNSNLGDLLGFQDMLSDLLLFDDGDSSIAPNKKLVNDLTDALAAAGLSAQLKAQGDGTSLKLVATDSATSFSVTPSGAGWLGFTGQSSSGGVITATNGATLPNLTADPPQEPGDAVLNITINGVTTDVTVSESALVNNTVIGYNIPKLLYGDKSPTFTNAQEFAERLVSVLSSITGLTAPLAYDPGTSTLQFTLGLTDQTLFNANVPLNFNFDLSPIADLSSTASLSINANGTLSMDIGISLADADASTLLTVNTPLNSLHGGDRIDIKAAPSIMGSSDVVSVDIDPETTYYGRFNTNATFNVSINGGPETTLVTITGTDNDGTIGIDASTNRTIIDLVVDVRKAIKNAGLENDIGVDFSGNRLLFTGGTGVTSFTITPGDATSATRLGLANAANPSTDYDILIKTTAGCSSHKVTLDGALDVGDVIDAIVTQTGGSGTIDKTPTTPDAIEGLTFGDVDVAWNEDRSGLKLIDLTTDDGNSSTVLAVLTLNGSKAALELRIAGVDGLDDGGDFDGILNGGQIASVTPADRFYLENAVVSADVTVATPGDVDLSATFGEFVTIGLSGSGSLNTGMEMGLKNPDTGIVGGRVTLAELVRGLDDIESVIQAPKFDGGGSLAFDVELSPDLSSLISLGTTPQIAINIDNPFAVSILTDALTAFELGTSSFDIQLDVPGYSPHTLNVSLAAVETTGLTTAEGVAGVLNAAIQAAQDIELGAVVPSYVVAEATSGGGIALRLLENTSISNFTIANATGGAVSILGFDTNTLSDYVADLDFNFTDLGDLLKFQAPEFNFDSIMEALGRLVDFLGDFEEFDFLNSNLPLLDVSVNDVLDFADRLSVALNEALANPAGSIQMLEQKLEEALGANTIGLTLDSFSGNDLLKLELDLAAAFSVSSSFSIPGIDVPVLGELDLGGSADLVFSGNLNLDLDFAIDLNNPLDIYVYNTTGLSGNLFAAAPDLDFRAALGPLGLFIKDGVANISGSLDAGFAAGADALVALTDFATLASDFEVDLGGYLNINLPTYFPSEFNEIGAFSLNVNVPDWTEFDISDVTFTLPDFTDISLADIGLFDSALLIVDGLDMLLEGLQDIMDGEVFGLDIPFVGNKLSAAGGFIEDFSAQFIDPLRSLMESADDFQRNFTNPSENFISKLLFDLLGDPNLTTKDWSLNLLKQLPYDSGNTDNPDDYDPAPGDGVEDFIKLDTDGVNYVQWNFSLGDTYGVGTEVDMDLGIPGLGMEAEGNIGIAFDWDLDFGFGLSMADGFYLDIGDNNELFANVDITLPSSFTGKLAFLQLRAEDYEVYSNHDGTTNLAMAFAVDIGNKSDASDQKLAMSEFGNIDFDAGIAAEAVAELMLYLEVNASDLGLPADTAAGIPKVQSEFVLDWGIGSYNSSSPEDSTFVSVTDIGNAIQDGLHYVGFSHVSLDAGSFLSDVLGPIVSEVKKITEPVQPFIEVITTPIPILSDLGPPITLLDIAAAYGDVDPGLIYSIADIISLVNRIPDPDDVGALLIDFGDFVIFDSRATTLPGDQILSELWNPGLKTSGEGGLFDSLKSTLGGLDFDSLLAGVSGGDATSKSTMQALRSGDAGSGFAFPIFDDPSQIFGLLMGEPAVLVTYDMAPLYFEFEWSQFFSIYGPLGVSINIGFDANIDFAFGYDTLGIQEFVEGNFSNSAKLLNGFYISDTDQPTGAFGIDVPEIVLGGELWAAAELNLGVARAGVGGGVFAEIEFDLFDPNNDGRVRIGELLLNIDNEARYGTTGLPPLAVFDVHGELTAKLFAFLKVDLFFFEIDETFNITPEITLLEYDMDFARVPVLATELDNGDLVLNMGRFAGDRLVDDLSDNIDMLVDQPEEFRVDFTGEHTVEVWATNLGSDATNHQTYTVTGKIIAYGDEGDDSIVFSGVASSVEYLIEGGVGDDVITLASTATGKAIIRGGDGDDEISSAGGADHIWGGRGIDHLWGGDGDDIIFGDDGEITTGTNANAAALLKFDDQGDFIYGEGNDDLLFGGGGEDTIEGGLDDDVILGDGGRIVIATKAVSDTNRGSSSGPDKLFGNSGLDDIYGGRGDDIIDGGADTDDLYGEDGDDTIYGGGDADNIFGADGDDVIWGLRDPDAAAGEFDSGDATSDGDDVIEGNAGDDLIHGNAGDDTIHGNSGADEIYGEDDADTIYGEGGSDLIYGGHGTDTIDGGADHDIIFGDDGVGDFTASGTEPSPNPVVYGLNLPTGLPEHYEFGVTKSASYSATIEEMIDTIYSFTGSDFIDGQGGPDVYIIRLQGADNASFINVYDSGEEAVETDYMQVFGTMYDDNFLLRASVSQDGLAFVALLNEAPNAERINYWNLERMLITGSFGDDYFAVDDVRAETTITGDVGEDRFQVGQLYRSPRDAGASEFNNIASEDIFATIETTVGWLSDGINRPMTIYGGVGNDYFTVFHNKAVLSLFGEDGDDTFLIKAFALAGSQEPFRDRTDVSGGAGVDLVQYAMNAPVNIDGGDGFDTVIIIGTEFGDDFVITKDGVYGAGLNVNFVNIESLSVDGAEGDDRFYVQSTSEKFITQIFGGLGSDTFNISGDMPPVISNDLQGHSGVIRHSIEKDLSVSTLYDQTVIAGIAANVYDNEPGLVVVVIEADGNTEVMEGGY
ncbi:MAG: calcium-binding protein, partial [Desulfuromonadales bacterium]|nr:calcium-binding protein [Desulfuromonadales bacterium]